MEPNDCRLNSHYHGHGHGQHQHQQSRPSPSVSAANGLLLKPEGAGGATSTHSPLMYTQSVLPSTGITSADGCIRRKRGRPRKYATPEQALAAKKAATSMSQVSHKKRDSPGHIPNKLSQLANAGQGFTAHVIDVMAGEDVYQKIMLLMQQSRREICILSASGSISNAALRQPATSGGGGIMYEGQFELVSLSGSYVRTDSGERCGGLSVCLYDTSGQIIGGGVGGPLVAGGPVQVIVGSFQIGSNKGNDCHMQSNSPAGQLKSPIGSASMSGVGYRPDVESSGRGQSRRNDDNQNVLLNAFMTQSRNMHTAPQATTDWMGGSDARSGGSFEFLGRSGRLPIQSPESGEYSQMEN
uniref:AT-hook motif nuclear-localized protein n=1 Tax=Kalanchoe fedtschenkoi TaxID=63787 RepID=A0A7N0UYF9_KALFE